MCGILVVFSKNHEIDVDLCDQALEMLKFRGPDATCREIYYNNRLFFGQTVLSITGDPTNGMNGYHKSLSKRFDVMFNGEIYNYQELFTRVLRCQEYPFFSGTDTEILVNLHELKSSTDVYNELKGMFAYVVYDNHRRALIVGRDIIGEKILYFYEDESVLIISSEIGPILRIKPSVRINRDVLREYFFTRHLLTPRDTVFKAIKLIQPGHLLEYSLESASFKTLQIKKPADLINPDVIEKNKRRTIDDLADELESIFDSNAKALTPLSTHYSAVFSGGVDSSLSSLFLTNGRPPLNYIALQFSGKDKVSEDLYRFEKRLNLSITKVKADVELFCAFFEDCLDATCAPLATHSFISQAIMTKRIRQNGTKVLIGGDGGDEIFGGYEFYKQLSSYTQFPEMNPSIYSGFVPHGVQFQDWKPQKLYQDLKDRWQEFSTYYQFESNPRERMLQTVLYSDSVIQLESVGIRAADTMSMLNSVEARCFYLTYEILQFALNLPAHYKIDLDSHDECMITRPLLKRIFIRKFGKSLLYPKQGFSGFPNEAGRLLVGNNYPLVRKVLGLNHIPHLTGEIARAVEWKLMNTELFLERFSNYI